MPLTLGQVAALPELALVVRTGVPWRDRAVRWVAVSEHVDPAPWLEGGDLLLTTGMSIDDDPAHAGAYVDRLVAADVAALGFGVGLIHQEIPRSLVAAAERAGLPLLEVPQPIPFVAVSLAVSRLLSSEEYAESAASFDCQRRLIRAALAETSGQTGVLVSTLARHVHGFALHLDADGSVLTAWPAAAAARAAGLAPEVDRLRPRGMLASSSLATTEEHVVILPIGITGAADGFLVVGSGGPLRAADQAVMNLAVSLLSWEVSRPLVVDEQMDPWRRLLVTRAVETGLGPDVLADVGLASVNPARAIAMTWRGVAGRAVPQSVLADGNRVAGVVLCRRASGDLEGFATTDDDGRPPAGLTGLVADPGVHSVGLSGVLDLTIAANVRQAREQADRAAAIGPGMQSYGDEPTRGLTSLVDAATTASWAVGYLGELTAVPEGPELMDTLRAWLDQHGQVDAAAQRLGIHRHTVRHRIRRAEAVLGRQLDDPEVRADLWFALDAVRSRSAPPERQ